LDLQKEYDCVSWDFLRLILLKIGIKLKYTNWIMRCVKYPNFGVSVNGGPTSFFKRKRGLRKGCPL
jgi:hypothetical protein